MSLVNPDEGEGVSDTAAVKDTLPGTGVTEKDRLPRQVRMKALAVVLFFGTTALVFGPCCSCGAGMSWGTPTPTKKAHTVVVGTPTPPPSQVMVPMSP